MIFLLRKVYSILTLKGVENVSNDQMALIFMY